MKLSKDIVFKSTIVIIIFSWIHSTFFKDASSNTVPESTVDLILMIILFKVVTFAIVYILLKLQEESFVDLDFNKIDVGKQILRGSLYGLLVFIIVNIVLSTLLESFMPSQKEDSAMIAHINKLAYFPVWIFLSIFAAGFVEEFERIFVLTRFEKWLGKSGIWLSLIISSIVFGLGHLYQGINGAIITGVAGFLYGLIYLRKRQALEAVAAHAVFDIVGITIAVLIY